jgi:hypothetical protein
MKEPHEERGAAEDAGGVPVTQVTRTMRHPAVAPPGRRISVPTTSSDDRVSVSCHRGPSRQPRVYG